MHQPFNLSTPAHILTIWPGAFYRKKSLQAYDWSFLICHWLNNEFYSEFLSIFDAPSQWLQNLIF